MAAAEPGSQMQITGLLVACFGIVYAICAYDIARFRPVLWAGVIGKAGVIAMTTTWAKELGKYGIRSAAIAPGFVSTPILEAMKQSALEKLIKRIPLQRLAQPEEIAEAAEFIFTNDYFSGRVLELDGGMRI